MLVDNCEQLAGRLRSICNGEAGLPLSKINAYRDQWGLPPLEQRARSTPSSLPKITAASATPRRSCCGGKKTETITQRAKKMVDRAALLAQATMKHLADDNAITPDGALEFRTSQCESCPLRVGRECDECGCVLYPNLLNQGKIRWRSEACPLGKWHRQRDSYQPLVNPTRNMIFHIYPLRGAEWNWHWHLKLIRNVASIFNGRIAIGIATGPHLTKPEIVQKQLESVPVTDWIIRENSKRLGETTTFVDLLKCVETDDPNTVTFRGHCKGVTHRRDGIEQPWARLMWSTCMDLASVDDALASHIMAGPMKCHEPLVSSQKYRWFFAGTFFWFRNREVFQRDWSTMEQTRWYPEAWPGVICTNEESASLVHDFTDGAVISSKYWQQNVAPEFERWKAARPNRRLDLE